MMLFSSPDSLTQKEERKTRFPHNLSPSSLCKLCLLPHILLYVVCTHTHTHTHTALRVSSALSDEPLLTRWHTEMLLQSVQFFLPWTALFGFFAKGFSLSLLDNDDEHPTLDLRNPLHRFFFHPFHTASAAGPIQWRTLVCQTYDSHQQNNVKQKKKKKKRYALNTIIQTNHVQQVILLKPDIKLKVWFLTALWS